MDGLLAYTGAKWGPFLRAPDLYFELLERARERSVELASIARVTYGVKSGADAFFYLRDITETELKHRNADELLRERFDLTREQLGRRRLRLVRGLGGLVVPIERRYLKPILFNLMEVTSIQIGESTTRRRALVVDQPRRRLRTSWVLDYIAHGEREGIHERPTCATRVTRGREWYELRPAQPATILWSQAHQYRHVVPYNPERVLHNKRLFSIHMNADVDDRLACAVLNSTLVCFYKLYLGRLVGREGIIDTDVSAVEELVLPDPRRFSDVDRDAALRAFEEMSSRSIDAMAPRGVELEHPDRRALDEAVLRACGIDDAEAVRVRLYEEVTRRLTETRELEEIAMRNRTRAARAGRGPSAGELAGEITEALGLGDAQRFPDNFLPDDAETQIIEIPDGAPEVGQGLFTDASGATARGSVRYGAEVIDLGDDSRAEYVAELSRVGLRGAVAVPSDPQVCTDVLAEWGGYQEQVRDRLGHAVAERTGNERLQRRTLTVLYRSVFGRS